MKVLILDLDGVVIKKGERFSKRYPEKYRIGPELVNDFFKKEFEDCLLGKVDLRVAVADYIKKWKWHGSIDELFEFWFAGERNLNKELIAEVGILRKKNVPVYIATNNELNRLNYLKKELGLTSKFSGIFASAQLGVLKPDAGFYAKVTELTGANKKDIYYWDDDEENVKGAKNFGWQAFLFDGVSQFLKKLRSSGIP